MRNPPRPALVTRPCWRSLDRKAFRPLTSRGHRLARADRLRVEGPLPLRARRFRVRARLGSPHDQAGRHASSVRRARTCEPRRLRRIRRSGRSYSMETQAIESARRSHLTAIGAYAHGTRRGGRALVDRFSHAPPHRFARLPSEAPRQEMRIASGSLALDRAFVPLPCESERARSTAMRSTDFCHPNLFGEHSRFVVLPAFWCKGALREAKRFALAWRGGTLRSLPGSRPKSSIDGLGARRCGKARETARFTARGNRFGGSISLHGGRCRPGRCGSIEPLTPLSHHLASALVAP